MDIDEPPNIYRMNSLTLTKVLQMKGVTNKFQMTRRQDQEAALEVANSEIETVDCLHDVLHR